MPKQLLDYLIVNKVMEEMQNVGAEGTSTFVIARTPKLYTRTALTVSSAISKCSPVTKQVLPSLMTTYMSATRILRMNGWIA